MLGFSSNDFGQQEPGDSKKIADFCFNTYGVEFPMFAKTVVGKAAHPLYAALARATGKASGWNFNKYLIERRQDCHPLRQPRRADVQAADRRHRQGAGVQLRG